MTLPQGIGLVALLIALYLGVGVFDHELWAPTEQAVAGVAWEMFRTGDLLVPSIDGLPYLEKPPLAYLLPWLGFELAGHASASLLRAPSALLGLGAIHRASTDSVAVFFTFLCFALFLRSVTPSLCGGILMPQLETVPHRTIREDTGPELFVYLGSLPGPASEHSKLEKEPAPALLADP